MTDRSASRSPRSIADGIVRRSPSTPAPAARCPSAPSPRSCSTRSAGPAYAQPRRRRPLRHASGSSQVAPDRVRISGTRGEPPPATLKVCDEPPRRLPQRDDVRADRPRHRGQGRAGARTRLWRRVPRPGRDVGDDGRPRFVPHRPRRSRPGTSERPAPRERAGRRTSAPSDGRSRRRSSSWRWPATPASSPRRRRGRPRRTGSSGRRWSTPADVVDQSVVLDDGRRLAVDPSADRPAAVEPIVVAAGARPDRRRRHPRPGERAGRAAFGARSGDKGGNANLGVWARDDDGYRLARRSARRRRAARATARRARRA